jgi:hypothetical protein
MLFASHVQPLIYAARSGDVSLVPKVVEWFRTNLIDPQPPTLEMLTREADRLLSGRLKGHAETEDHVQIISALANILGVQGKSFMIADGAWKQEAWDVYFDAIKGYVGQETALRFAQLAQCKRPLFGSSIETGWSYYGYLLAEEVCQLLAGLNSTATSHPDIASSNFINGFHDELIGWLHHAQERTTDLWLYAA